jgi:hypothetical protein
MKIWASCCSITLDEFLPSLGRAVKLSFSISPTYIGKLGAVGERPHFSLDFRALPFPLFLQVPELHDTATAITGHLTRAQGGPGAFAIDSRVVVRVQTVQTPWKRACELLTETADPITCQAFGGLSFYGNELSAHVWPSYLARIYRFESLCLRGDDPRFGKWVEIEAYKDLLSDPDVNDAPVCRAEIDLE